jgi:hypothetical protein
MKRSLLTAIVFALLIISGPRQVHAVPNIFVGPYTVPVTPGEPFLVPIQITGAVNTDFFQFSLSYDPTDLQINDPAALDFLGRPVTEGEFFSSLSPFNVFNPGFILLDGSLSQIGTLLEVNDTFGGTLPGPSGNGILAYVEFVTAINGTGDSVITVTDQSATSSVSAPEPTSLLLLAGGLAFVRASGLIKRRRRTDV